MEEKTAESLFNAVKNELFTAVGFGNSERAKSLITDYAARYPELINAVNTIQIPAQNNQPRGLTTPLLLYILSTAKHEFGKKDKTKEAGLLDLAQLVLAQSKCDILALDSNRNTALHHAIWYIYPEIATAIISKAQQTNCVKQLCAIKNNFKENANYVLYHAFKQTAITPETELLQLNQIRVLITQALEQEKQFRIGEQQKFAETSKDIWTEFHQELGEVVLEDPITLDRLISPINILPQGNTLGSFFFTDPNNKKPNVNPTTQCTFEGCDLYVVASVPEALTTYINSYILTDQELFYIKHDGQSEKIVIDTAALLDNLKKISAGNPFKYYLSDQQVQDLITSSSKHVPFGKGHRVPHFLATEILNLYPEFSANQAEEFFAGLESLLYCKFSNQLLIQPCVIAEKGKIFDAKKTDLYGHTCNEFEIYNVNTYKDLLVIKLLELKEKYNQKLAYLAKSAEEQAKQMPIVPDEVIPAAPPTSTATATEKLAIVEISNITKLPDGMAGTTAKVFEVYSTPEYLGKIDGYLCQHIMERFNFDTIQCAWKKDHLVITVSNKDNGDIMSKVENFFVTEKILTQEQSKQGGTITAGPPVNPHYSNASSTQLPPSKAVVPVVFSNIPSPKSTFPKPTAIKYQSVQTAERLLGQITFSYNPKDFTKILAGIPQLELGLKFHANISQSDDRNILIKTSAKREPTPTNNGIFLIKEGQQDMLYLKFPNRDTKNTFIAIFNLDQYINQHSLNMDDTTIKFDPQLLPQQTEIYQKTSTCLVM